MQRIIILLFLFITNSSNAQKYVMPFHLNNANNIVVKAVINKIDTMSLMLHTGVSNIILIEDAIARTKSLTFNNKVDSVQSWGGNNNTAEYSTNNILKIGDIEWQKITIWKDKYSGPETDGKFGLNLFENKCIEVDYNNNQLIVSNTLPKKIKDFYKFSLDHEDGLFFIRAICQIDSLAVENKFMLHSGYAGNILLDDKFVIENNIGSKIKITGERKLKDSYGNLIITKKGILPFLKIGKLKLPNIPIGFFEGTIGRQQISILGGDVLKRFNWIVDAERKFIYLKPNKHFSSEYSKV